MSEYRPDPPPDELIEMLFTENGKLYWKPEHCKGNRKEGKAIGLSDNRGYLAFTSARGQEDKKTRCYKVHRVINYLVTGEWPPIVDHKDGNTLNNHPDNLRSSCTVKNMQNRRKQKNNSSGYMGVRRSGSTYSAGITINRKLFQIHGYKNPEAAALARDILAKLFYSDQATMNFIDKGLIIVDGVETAL
ncbi:HNH endonuclease [Salmonella enterica]|nr:HNH endonuclease [Salmonella enterica]